MGHRDLSALPRTPAFKRVISTIGESMGGGGAAGVLAGTLPAIADATIEASDVGLHRAKSDEGIAYCIYLMSRVVRAAASDDFIVALQGVGISIAAMTGRHASLSGTVATDPSALSPYDLVSGFGAAVDRHLRETKSRSDVSELAQLSATESIAGLCAAHAGTLYGPHVQSALKSFATKNGFGRLAQDFFARLSRRYIEYHLGRELSNHVGGKRRFGSIVDHNRFLRELDDHCRLATKPIAKFAGDWYSLHNFQGDLTLAKAKGFAAHAIDKLRDALRYEGGGDDE